MMPGDLCQIRVPPNAHPRDDYLDGMLVMIIGKSTVISANREYIKCLFNGIQMIPIDWLEFDSEVW